MILVIDAINKDRFSHVLDEMFKLRARVFGDRLGWQVEVKDGRERDLFDDLNPAYAVGLDDEGNVVSCVRALQTTGPHMLADVFADILDGEPPLRSATLWESTRFCVDTRRLGRGRDRNSVSYATCELMIASLEAAKRAGVSDIVTVIDPVMDRVLKRSGNAPYDYVGKTADMGKVPALAALLDCTDERIDRIRAFGGVEGDVFISDDAALALPAIAGHVTPKTPLEQYCDEQIASATSEKERIAALRLKAALEDKIRSRMDQRA
ncbi:Acyl-homoserine-lactone synthase [Roseovarius sp. EC-HK134]|jgi:acyl homoserine lactone synthase|uniref:Acyl-homoserine-lactone synthase n=1 Tax=Roseovarius mucosus TaxID=215743 RepID=A0A1V0RK37_9RHOB|nr:MULTISPECIES: acyl-homoserine-lactone synthase [Roseovarius]MBS4011607.1 autoinducer synthase [Roseovarius sp.]ARE82117.1 acyl-homoserine-lactone synthase [Roseovarius mucosus]MBW4972431.1 autoinducer synthase [Roseovarius mucosus]VVT26567.1 Acyl-homoserine-lactone synthase [Roseovarius sp. EC-HK134]VVT26667.1 Acyl-homoserine-lactone synthase [Roseovarius sp. EC-SD190]|tara:strand:- start:5256 stop:6050 length:795 start_codon:yes stop_codon:yes gene_type:complete